MSRSTFVSDFVLGTDKTIALVAEGRAFLFSNPMRSIRYRTVFDVDFPPGMSSIDAWSADAPPGSLMIINGKDLMRYQDTYSGIPKLSEEERMSIYRRSIGSEELSRLSFFVLEKK
jgi:hypothetical protein